ncbi:MAG: hypothetical protein Q4C20_13150 [Erysipelotrichaceae bacterium]|nr:hypothetical protein [Erysipelotrichaceae bacterium]
MMGNGCIFRYELADAWKMPISRIEVFQSLNGGVIRTFLLKKPAESADLTSDVSNETVIEQAAVNQIIEAIKKYDEVLSFKEVEFPFVMDGSINTFGFADGNQSCEIQAYNIWAAARKEKEYLYFEKPVKAKLLLELFTQIANVLITHNIGMQYFQLDIH